MSSDFPVTAGALLTQGPLAPWHAPASSPDGGFLTELDPQGSKLIYSMYTGSPGSVALDAAANTYSPGLPARIFR